MTLEEKNGNNRKNIFLVGVVSTLIWSLTFYCYFVGLQRASQTLESGSDYLSHIEFGVEMFDALKKGFHSLREFRNSNRFSHILSYPLWHFIMLLFGNAVHLFRPSIEWQKAYIAGAAAANATCISLTFILISAIMLKQTNKSVPIAVKLFLSVALLLVGPFDASEQLGGYYLGGYTGNVWHNPTYFLVKPIGLFAFVTYAQILKEKKGTRKQYLLAAFLLVLSAVQALQYIVSAGI